ncbi:endonuclease/exonuclease/phosphatase family protein [Aerosakkonemataceae cyanobacterium BLCC-F154]|uniref:Endonuclease/exonuclease/phosphatase family protein n=1 Tax=Floridaenema fluviatile BLCC-F154 TaxID=3153640 RepID=A0ABV4YEZ4_9CYAN
MSTSKFSPTDIMLQRIIVTIPIATLIVLGLLSLLVYIAWFWPLELIAHFRVQYLILAVILTIVLIVLRQIGQLKNKALIIAALLIVGLNAVDVIPWYLPHSQQVVGTPGKPIRVLSFNLNIQNNQDNKVVNLIQSNRPDLTLLAEVDAAKFKTLKNRLKDTLPYSFKSPGGGLVVFSRFPFADIRADRLNSQGNHNIIANVIVNQQLIKFIGIHPLVPINSNNFHRRNSQLAAVTNYIQQQNQPLILVGDFNITPWSPYYRQLINKTKLYNTRLGFGILPSWPRPATHVRLPSWLIPLVNIPIDHCLVSQQFRVRQIYTGANANSDHASLIIDLVLQTN